MVMIDINNSITEPFIRDAKYQASRETDLEKGTQVLQSNSDFGMDEFNKQIQEAEIQVDKLSGLLINLKTLLKEVNEESKSATNTSEIKAIKKRMEKYIDDVGKNACNVRGKLQVITIDNIFHRQMPGCQKGTACDRERMNMTNVLTKKIQELLMEFEALRQTIQDCEVVERQVTTVTGTRPDEMVIDHLIETGNSKQIFPTTFEQMGRGKVTSTMEEEIQERLDAVKEFEKRFLELYQLYLKTTVLVEGHAKILDKMENQVTDAVNRIKKFDENQKIQKLQNMSKNWMIYYMLFMVVIILINVLASQERSN
ncbi:syntaxin-132-like isoform X2 [Benincasa hispida]|uniref:syntaxin-132-like isoform X2 n=1 Tax=Benincasa hispida TaxID=102211 RepID=UPI0018FF17D8|nr:syntaxin-132-like isoform X2 [Benincasa hispida]